MSGQGEHLLLDRSPTGEAGRATGDHDAPLRVISRSVCGDDGGYAVGELEIECGPRDCIRIESLVDAYHPRVDVFEVRSSSADGPIDTGHNRRVLVKVQCASDDAGSLWALLERRLQNDHHLDLEGGRCPTSTEAEDTEAI